MSTTKIKNSEITEFSQTEQLNEWTIPSIEAKKIYKLGFFKFISQKAVKTVDQIVQTPEGDVMVTFAPDDVNRITLPRSMSCRVKDKTKQMPYNVSIPSSSRNSVSGEYPPWNTKLKPSRKLEEIDLTPSEIQEEIHISEEINSQ